MYEDQDWSTRHLKNFPSLAFSLELLRNLQRKDSTNVSELYIIKDTLYNKERLRAIQFYIHHSTQFLIFYEKIKALVSGSA